MKQPTIEGILAAMGNKDYPVFDSGSGYNLNLVGIRSNDMVSNEFNDWFTVFHVVGNEWELFCFRCTTDPGLYYRENPINADGTAILKPGRYQGTYQIGFHQGKYEALVQKEPVVVHRDANRDNVLDYTGVEQKGMFGINIHRASTNTLSTEVDKWSAGCQVLRDPNHFDFLMGMCRTARGIYGNSFTYTLLEEKDFKNG